MYGTINVGYATTDLFTVTVAETGWSSDSSKGYYKELTVEGILASDTPMVDVVLTEDIEANNNLISAWAEITRITTAKNKVTLWANSGQPMFALTLQMRVVR